MNVSIPRLIINAENVQFDKEKKCLYNDQISLYFTDNENTVFSTLECKENKYYFWFKNKISSNIENLIVLEPKTKEEKDLIENEITEVVQ